jgi:glycosyltransferase involved in cell wall biosynthesis
MKICLTSDTYPPDVGGLAISVRRQAQGLAAAGHAVHVVSPGRELLEGAVVSQNDGPVAVHRLSSSAKTRETLSNWLDQLLQLDQQQDFDLFHGHFLVYAGYLAALAGRTHGKPSVASARGDDLDVFPFDERRAHFVHAALDWANRLVAVTASLASKAQALSGRRDVRLIHNGVDANLFAPAPPDLALRQGIGLDERPVIGFIGEARAKKGLSRLLRLYARLYERTEAQLLLVGGVRPEDVETLAYFQRQHPELPIDLVPTLEHAAMPAYYALCDIVLLPSLRDGLPNTLLEAMACARPVVASRVGGMMDVLTDGQDGLLLPPRDDAAWLDALEILLRDPQSAARLGEQARRTVRERFTIQRELEQTMSIYQEVCC